jgi:site-specific DNA-methyltransferase (adenine-specific)
MSLTITNEDNMALMARYPDNYFDLAIVDPPYGISVNMNAGRKKDTKSKKRTVKKWDNEIPTKEYFDELFRVSKNQIIWGANHMIDKIQINSQGWIFWDKCVAEGCSFSDGELAWSSFNQALKKAIIPYSGFIGMEGEKFHPTTKPSKLYKWLLDKYAKQGDKILDTHLLTACELDKEYFDKAIQRIKNHTSQQKLF